MKNSSKRKAQLIRELSALQKRVAELEGASAVQRRTEQALVQYWSLLEAILSSSRDLFGLKGVDGAYLAASSTFCQFAGRPEDEIRGRGDFELFPKNIAEVFHRHDTAVLRTAQPYSWEETLELPEGPPRWYRLHKTPVLDEGRVCVGLLCMARDLTSERRGAAQVKIFSRIGQDGFLLLDMHGNILEVNERYCGLTGYERSELLSKNLHEIEMLTTPEDLSLRNQRIRELGWDHFKTLHRAKDNRIVEFEVCANFVDVCGGRFYRFFKEVTTSSRSEPARAPAPGVAKPSKPSKPKDRNWRVVNMNDMLREALSLQLETLPSDVEVVQDLDDSLWNGTGNRHQLVQIVMNLIINAFESIDGRGRIDLSTRNFEMTPQLAKVFPQLIPGRYVYLAVEDNGRGINDKLIGKIFEPFITTKYRGRGMGLASAWRSVKDHGGYLGVKSKVGEGSTFSVYLPASEEPLEFPSKVSDIPTGTETVLIVEDESDVARDTRKMLEGLAYTVIQAQNLDEAAELMRNYKGPIDLVLVDVARSGLEEEDLRALFRDARPKIKIILAGVSELDEKAQDLLDIGADTYVQKPFRAEVLVPRIRKTLDG